MSSRISLTVQAADGTTRQFDTMLGICSVGRDPTCHLVLSYDDVSWHHARLNLGESGFWVEDLHSSAGTWIQETRITEARHFTYPRMVQLGSVSLLIESISPARGSAPDGFAPGEDVATITATAAATERTRLPVEGAASRTAQRLALLYDLPLQFAAETALPELCRLILRQVMEVIPGARRGALLVIDPPTGKLAVRASIPEETPPISRTLVRRAALMQQGFIWSDESAQETAQSITDLRIRSGIYAALSWKGRTLGVLCVDNPEARMAFYDEDLQFMVSVANYAAAALANQLLQNDIETNSRTLRHLLANFSPKLRDKLLQKAREGRLQLGGEKSDVTILMCDLRGFTHTSATLECEGVVEMLNDYFSVLGDIVFQHDGTIDKFIGDAILAVFGSPEPDEAHALKAVRAGIAMQHAVAAVNARRSSAGLPHCELGIGIHTGEVLHGFIGTMERLEFTVIGDTVNKASRYCAAAAGGEVVLGPATNSLVADTVQTEMETITAKNGEDMKAWLVRYPWEGR